MYFLCFTNRKVTECIQSCSSCQEYYSAGSWHGFRNQIRCRNPYPLIAAAFAVDRARFALQAVTLKDDLVLRIRIFNLIGPIPRVLNVRVESRCA